ncbi:MAG: outer membrane protein transport protein, partial [Pseudomonadota bacterium]
MQIRSFVTIFAAIIFASGPANAAGFGINEHGARPLGMGNAFTAIANNPSAVFFNPAGLVQLKGLQLEAGISLLVPQTTYTTANPVSGNVMDVDSKTLAFPIPAAYASYRIHERVSIGIGMYSPFGMGIEWPDTVQDNGTQTSWWGRDIVQTVDLKTAYFNTSVAVKLSPHVFLGAGLNVVQGAVTMQRAIVSSENVSDDIHVRLSGQKVSFGGTGGILINAVPKLLNVGLSYRSGVPFTFEGIAAFTKNGDPNQVPAGLRTKLKDGKVETSINMPHTFSLGLAAFPIENLSVGFALDITTWSSFQELAITFVDSPDLSTTQPENWHNTMALRLGAEFQILHNLPARLGFVFDQSP